MLPVMVFSPTNLHGKASGSLIKQTCFINRVWHKNIPFKLSFLCWRLIKAKLPFNDVICRFTDRRQLECLCCDTPQPETIRHVFINSEHAQKLWKNFGQPLGIKCQSRPVKSFLHGWWQTPGKNAIQKMLIQITPVAICWEIWKMRCACRYGNQTRFYTRRMEQQIYWHIKAAIDKAFPLY